MTEPAGSVEELRLAVDHAAGLKSTRRGGKGPRQTTILDLQRKHLIRAGNDDAIVPAANPGRLEVERLLPALLAVGNGAARDLAGLRAKEDLRARIRADPDATILGRPRLYQRQRGA